LDLVSRFARTHTPFRTEDVAHRFGIGIAPVRTALQILAAADRVWEGEFTPGARGREWCDAEVLKSIKRRSLARLRKQIEPVEPVALARFLAHWQGLTRPRRGLDGLLDTIEQLQGAPIPASVLESNVLPARVADYRPALLDELFLAGEVVWRGVESLGPGDGRVALYLTDKVPYLAPTAAEIGDLEPSAYERQIVELLSGEGALFFDSIQQRLNAFAQDVLDSLWRLTWSGRITNDTLAPLRSLVQGSGRAAARTGIARRGFRSRRRPRLPGSEGRWTLFGNHTLALTPTERQAALARQLVERYGIVTRQLVASENVAGGFAGLYPVLNAMEQAGRARRGYFITGQGAAQFAAPGAEDRLREPLAPDHTPNVWMLAATDPANPYGSALPWPETPGISARPLRAAGARVILRDGRLLGYVNRSGKHLLTFLSADDSEPATARTALIETLRQAADGGAAVVLQQIDGRSAGDSGWADDLKAAGFLPLRTGLMYRRQAAR
jgi:ATP-dependent Lhr-like helicase